MSLLKRDPGRNFEKNVSSMTGYHLKRKINDTRKEFLSFFYVFYIVVE